MTLTWSGRSRLEPVGMKVPEAVRLSGLSRSRMYELIKRATSNS
jgi:predicted DNA-binding transcriptional regulator AlpA